jgi:hypothetical protein
VLGRRYVCCLGVNMRAGYRIAVRFGRACIASVSLGVAGSVALVSVGCGSSVTAYTTAGQPTVLSKYKTFGVVVPDPEELKENHMQPETLHRLAELSVERMQGLGYKPVAADNADLLIGLSPEARLYGALRVVNGEQARPNSSLDKKFDAEGTLTVNFVDMTAKQIVLTRVAKTRVSMQLGEEQMREIVTNVFDGMPRAAD